MFTKLALFELIFCVSGLSLFVVGPAFGQVIIAHRGASRDAPENTLAAFRLAFEKEADGIEGDFRLTSDGQIVCIHDADTERVSNETLVVADSTLAQLKAIDVGRWKGKTWDGETIPTLLEVLRIVPDDKYFFIELKCGPEIVGPLKGVLSASSASMDKCVVISFDQETIKACRKAMPKLACQWLTSYKPESVDDRAAEWAPSQESVLRTLQGCDANGLGCKANKDAFTPEFINYLGGNGYSVFHVWTVDDVSTARHYQQLGAFGITTNRPKYIRDGLKSLEKSASDRR